MTANPANALIGSFFGLLVIAVCLFVLAALYFIPSIVAFQRKKASMGAIFALNILLGWSFIGWVIALIWALKADIVDRRVYPA